MATRVLVVDDDAALRRMMRRMLVSTAYQLAEAPSAEAAIQQAAKTSPDLVLLDLTMPGMGGLAFISQFRTWSEAPIIVLSVEGDEATQVEALNAGADDYVTKPFRARELLARVARQVARWEHRRRGPALAAAAVFRSTDGYLVVDPVARTAQAGGNDLQLTGLEFDLLAYLASHADQVVTSRQLLQAVWGINSMAPLATVRTTVYRLRRKLEPESGPPRYIITQPAIGYRLRSTPP